MSEDQAAAARQRTLHEAQEALRQRRAALQEARAQGCAPWPDPRPDPRPAPHPVAPSEAASLAARVAALPPHLCWENARLTAVLRHALARREAPPADDRAWLAALAAQVAAPPDPDPAPAAPPAPPAQTAVPQAILYPDLAQAILRAGEAAAGRLWHLLRAIDSDGRGWLSLDEAAAAFTAPGAPLRFCGARQLRNLLARGEALFWQTGGGRIWLRAPARVAAALGVARLSARPVALPAAELAGGIGAARAHFYAAFHSARRRPGPISRRALAARSGVAPRTQRAYDRRAGVQRAANYARGPRLAAPGAQELAWQKGPACFTWHERRPGGQSTAYLAWQLPNSYDGPHAPCARGRQKRAQRHLADLLHQGTAGNEQKGVGREPTRAYFADPRAAARAYGRAAFPAYWPAPNGRFWYCLC